ncbi:hypothetical protein SAMN05421800_11516 [Chryseobacterium balustinum]|uniref:Uncharacterized protein n=1 Tax=Chryseobacterium balustinum TaxID=246 RepID=A0ABY1LBC0_9FLAO|nr:hypothetical protein SAMN05421800_11516 [Chryseobacterium balustinum]
MKKQPKVTNIGYYGKIVRLFSIELNKCYQTNLNKL